jgi:hypothetical protein
MLEYVTLGILCVGLTLAFYTFVYIHDIPYEIAKKRNHPQVEAIHIACVLSLFTLHALWPLVFIWAVIKPNPLQVAISEGGGSREGSDGALQDKIAALETRIADLEAGRAARTEGDG